MYFVLTNRNYDMTTKIDPDIFHRIKEGDVLSFNKLFDTYYTSLCFFAVKFLADIDISRSLVQQLFVDLWMKRDKLDTIRSVKSYLYTSVRNRCIDQLRLKQNTLEMSSEFEDITRIPFHDLVEEAEINDLINNSVNQLPEKCREIFILCRYEGLRYTDVAQKLNLSVKTVEMQMGIALRRLRESIKRYQIVGLAIYFIKKK